MGVLLAFLVFIVAVGVAIGLWNLIDWLFNATVDPSDDDDESY